MHETKQAFEIEAEYSRALLDSATEGILALDLEGNTKFVNPAAAGILGYTPEELIGKPAHAIVHSVDPNGTLWPSQDYPNCSACATGEVQPVQKGVFWRKDGSRFSIELRSIPVHRSGRLVGVAITFIDVSKRKEQGHWLSGKGHLVKEERREAGCLEGVAPDATERTQAERELEVLSEELEDKIRRRTAELDMSRKIAVSLMRDAEREKQRAEHGLEQLKESTKELRKLQQAVEQSPVSVIITDPGGAIEYVNPFAAELTQYKASELIGANPRILKSGQHPQGFYRELWRTIIGGRVWRGELCSKKKDGTLYWERSTISPVRDTGGEIANFVAVKEDITEQRAIREDLVIAKEQAEAATRAKSAFLAMMSHEIRTPMNGVVGMLDLLTQTSLDGEQQRLCRIAKQSTLSLLQVINDVLDFSKIEAGRMTLESVPVSWTQLVEGVADLLSSALLERRLKLYCLPEPDLSEWVMGDPVRLRQILMNLVSNAIKFTETTAEERGEIRVVVKREGGGDPGNLSLEVSDNGVGISPQQRQELFKPFVQADTGDCRRSGGTGLGLSICARLSALMGGKIECTSKLGVGSTFRVRMPYRPTSVPGGEVGMPCLSGLKILVLCNLKLLADYLERDLVERGAEVIRSIDLEHTSDIVLTEMIDVTVVHGDWGGDREVTWSRSVCSDKKLKLNRFVVLVEGSEQAMRIELPNSVPVNANPFRPGSVRQAIAVAAGRASPEVPLLDRESEVVKVLPTLDEEEANGTLILVVEDDPISREVVEHQLNLLGFVAEVASNGREALDLLASRRFGLVLADCHMPVMDGFELVKIIREQESDSAARLPVVAFTANAMKGEETRCLAAGMDDVVTKPLELKRLRQVLQNWLPERRTVKGATRGEAHPSSRGARTDPVIDPALLASFMGDDVWNQRQLLERFVLHSEEDVQAIMSAVEAKDWESVKTLAHRLRSASMFIGATTFSVLCADLEQAGMDEDVDLIGNLSVRLGGELGQVKEYLASPD